MWPFCCELWYLELLNVWSIRLLESTTHACWFPSLVGAAGLCPFHPGIFLNNYLVWKGHVWLTSSMCSSTFAFPPCYSPRMNRGIMVGAFQCLKLLVGIRLPGWCHSGSIGMCCLCVWFYFAQVTVCCTLVLNHICFCMGDSWVYIPSGRCSDCWKQKRDAEGPSWQTQQAHVLHGFLWGSPLNFSGGCSWLCPFTSWNVLCRTWGCLVFTLSDYPVLKSSYLLEEFSVCINVCASTCSSRRVNADCTCLEHSLTLTSPNVTSAVL